MLFFNKQIFWKYSVAALSVVLATGLTFLIWPGIRAELSPFFFGAVIVCAWYGGFGPSLIAAALAAAAINYLFTSGSVDFEDLLQLSLFILVAWPISALARARKRGEDALRKSYAGLEQKIEQRTAKLSEANREMRAEIEARLQAEQRLRESEEHFRRAFDNAPIGMALLALDGRRLQVNRALCGILGYDESELLQKTSQDTSHPDDVPEDLRRRQELLNGTRTSYQVERRYIHKDGRVIWALRSVSLVRDVYDAPLHFITQVEDITARKQMEEDKQRLMHDLIERNNELLALQQEIGRVEPLAALGRMSAAIAHELGTPLNSVLGYTQLLAQEQLTESARRRLKTIESQTRRMVDIVQFYLDRTRDARRTFTEVDVNGLIRDTRQLLLPVFEAKNVALELSLAETLPPLRGHSAALQRALINLLNNAVDAVDSGGTVRIVSRPSGPSERLHPATVIEVRDNGPGIPDELLPKLFELFVTTKEPGKGTGLGLAVCEEIIKVHGGHIDITSKPGKGTAVQIYLPKAEQTMPSDAEAAA